ncbi:MAG: chemotaxis response regulator protein-glutamate methylesterase [Planctomycetes bacterium]|nr:chemotaxis response regulator protein-glutamate methylesterase [Planctomycetota bacterium]
MRRIRVLIVDDSVVIRRLLSDILAQEPAIEVVGTASNGRIALAKLPQLTPDLITLDVEMPELDGLATLTEIRKDYPKTPVIMFSTLTSLGAVATIDALSRGATDYVAKPANVGSVAAGIQSVKDQLVPKILALCPPTSPPVAARSGIGRPAMPIRSAAKRPATLRHEIVVVGCSTGGPQALEAVLAKLPADLPVPVVVVQHMPPIFTGHLAARLNQVCEVEVAEASGGEVLQAGKVLIAPGDHHLELVRKGPYAETAIHQGPPENSCRPAVDVLFRSAARVFGSGVLAVVLTGMGRDGLTGGQQIARSGGVVIAQDEATSIVWGMPRAVTEAGVSEANFSLNAIAGEIVRRASLGRRAPVLL